MKSHGIASQPCPACGNRLDRADETPGNRGRGPKPGDLTICWRCTAYLTFGDDGVLRVLGPGEFDNLHPSNQRSLRDIRRVMIEEAL